jgi:DNA-binding NarL/FixJ family response regulator
VLIVSARNLLGTSLRHTLHHAGITALAPFGSRQEHILAAAATFAPSLAVIDVAGDTDDHYTPDPDVVPALWASGASSLVIYDPGTEILTAAMIAAGAIGALPKSCSIKTLLHALGQAAQDQPIMTPDERHLWLQRHHRHQQRERQLHRRWDRLSRHEKEILRMMVEGQRAAAIAGHFTVSLDTVRIQIHAILTKLEVSSQLEAVATLRDHDYGALDPRGAPALSRVRTTPAHIDSPSACGAESGTA